MATDREWYIGGHSDDGSHVDIKGHGRANAVCNGVPIRAASVVVEEHNAEIGQLEQARISAWQAQREQVDLKCAALDARNRAEAEVERLTTEVSDLETIAQAVETHCWPRDGEEAYGWLMAQAVKRLRDERDRLVAAVVAAGIVDRFAQCPVCCAERTNGEAHEDGCDLILTR